MSKDKIADYGGLDVMVNRMVVEKGIDVSMWFKKTTKYRAGIQLQA